MPTTTALRLGSLLGAAAWATALWCTAASAQGVCTDHDAGMCEEDAGADTPPRDAGSDAGGRAGTGGASAGRDGGAADAGGLRVACSCHTESEVERGARIHVCTESFDRDVCRDFACERGAVRERGCPGDGVRLCCSMRGRGLQTSLYEDCTHPNCESGFREQCREFGGAVSDGPCESAGGDGDGGDGDESDGGGFCSVRTPGSGAGRAWALPLALALLALRLNRRRRAPPEPLAPARRPRRA